MSYDRCKEHGLVRCAVCSKRTTAISREMFTPSAVSLPSDPNWSPEDALDVPNLGTRDPNAGTEGPDPQSLAAAERLKPAAIEVDFGDDQPAEIFDSAHEVIESYATPVIDGMKTGMGSYAATMEPVNRAEMYASGDSPLSPVVAAAQAYAHAEDAVIHAEMTVQELTEQLEEAEIHLKRVIVERDEKKLALKEQVR